MMYASTPIVYLVFKKLDEEDFNLGLEYAIVLKPTDYTNIYI